MTRAVLILLLVAPSAVAQTDRVDASLDQNLLGAIYAWDGQFERSLFLALDRSSKPLFLLAAPALAGGALMRDGGDLGPAYRMLLTQAATYVSVYGLKQTTRKPRPYLVEEGIASRSPRHPPLRPSYSFPSTHAALAAGMAASLTLSHPEWWVIVPAASWASLVSITRLWMGVHYPSDVVAGWLVGGGMALVAHLAHEVVSRSGASTPADAGAVVLPLIRVSW